MSTSPIDSPQEPSPAQLVNSYKKLFVSVLKKLNKKRDKQLEELVETDKFTWYRQIGDSLLSAHDLHPRGTAKTLVFNLHTQKDEPVTLNPKLDIKENAELFYKKARKGERGAEANRHKIQDTEKEIAGINQLILQCEALIGTEEITEEQLSSLQKEASRFEPTQGPSVAAIKGAAASVPYRHFTIDDWDVFIGKTDAQNDELSTRFAKPSDYWLHVAGHAGSHVVIRRPKNSPPPPKGVIEKAAALSVWFSKAKHTSFAEVHVTEARFVRKRRHAPAGEVIAERCKSVRVSPISPQDMFKSEYDKGNLSDD